jgi:hypothetical protein
VTDPAFSLRAGQDGPLVEGTPGHVLAFQVDGTVAGIPVPSAPVTSVFSRTGAVVPVAGDYAASEVSNDSSVTGADVAAALDALQAAIPAVPVTSVFSRTGAVVPVAGDYAASEVSNDSSVTGADVAAALDALQAAIPAVPVTSVFSRTGAVVPVAGDYAASEVSNDSSVLGATVAAALDNVEADASAASAAAASASSAAAAAQSTATAAEQPYKATFYVDPAFVGTSTGSASNPFTTIAAAFAAAAALALPGAVFRIPPATTITENITFPATGGIWEITSDTGFTGSSTGPRITGAVTCNVNSGTLSVRLSNLIINGNTAGLAATGTILVLTETSVRQVGTITLTQAGTGVVLSIFRGIGPAYAGKTGGSNTGLVSVAGQISAENWVFEGGCTEALASIVTPYQGSTWRSCQLGSTNGTPVAMNLNGASNAFFYDCMAAGPVTFTSTTVGYTVFMDAATLAAFGNASVGLTLTGTGMVLRTLNANLSATTTVNGNVASTPYGGRSPAGLYAVDVSLTLTTAGTLGALQHNVIYTDATGALVTAPVGGTLNIAGALGTKLSATLVFEHNGAAAPIAFSFAGVTTAGAMAVSHISAVRRLN